MPGSVARHRALQPGRVQQWALLTLAALVAAALWCAAFTAWVRHERSAERVESGTSSR